MVTYCVNITITWHLACSLTLQQYSNCNAQCNTTVQQSYLQYLCPKPGDGVPDCVAGPLSHGEVDHQLLRALLAIIIASNNNTFTLINNCQAKVQVFQSKDLTLLDILLISWYQYHPTTPETLKKWKLQAQIKIINSPNLKSKSIWVTFFTLISIVRLDVIEFLF